MPTSIIDCPGTNSNEDITRIVSKIIKARNARLGKPGKEMILVKLIETPTKIKPSKAAEAPTSAIKKFSQPFMYCVIHRRSSGSQKASRCNNDQRSRSHRTHYFLSHQTSAMVQAS